MLIVKLKVAVFVALVLMLVGCGGLSKNTKLTDESEKGIVIASVTQKNATQNVFVWIRRVSDHDFVPSIYGNYTIRTPKLNVFELAPGEYEFFRWSIVGGNAWANKLLAQAHRFTVTKGKATYVGNFEFELLSEKELTWKVTDNSKDDINKFKLQFPLVGDNQIKLAIAKP